MTSWRFDGAITCLWVSLLVGEFFLPPLSWWVIALPSHAGQDPKHPHWTSQESKQCGTWFFLFLFAMKCSFFCPPPPKEKHKSTEDKMINVCKFRVWIHVSFPLQSREFTYRIYKVNAILHGSLDQSREQIMTNTLNKLYPRSTSRLLFFCLIILEHSKTICSHTVLHVTAKLCRSTTTSFSPVVEAHQSFSLMSCRAKPSHKMLHSSRGLHLLVTRTKAGKCSKSTSMQSNSHFWRQKEGNKNNER